MNHIYQLVWNALHQAWVAVSEVASGLGRRSNRTATDQRRKPGERLERSTIKKIAACAYAISTGTLFLINPAQVSAQTLAPTTLPQGGVVTQGAATLQGAGSSSAPVLNVNQTSQRAVINWNSFHLGSASTVNFNQPNTQSATLNRVLDMQPSQIFGRINAPGQVTLVNPAGVYFSPSAVLDVGALTATTLNQSDADFMAGTARFSRNGATGSVVNEGTLKAVNYIALLAPEVRNQGTITASAVVMAAGESIQLHFDAFSRLASLSVTPSQIATLVENRTAVLAPGGQIILSATALRGLQASVVNSGQIDASSLTAQGGRIVLEGDHIQLSTGSSLNASGASGGGTVLVGGDWQGSGSMAQATTVAMAQGASIDASATHSGDGGKVVLWSDVGNANSTTTVNGRITAQGIAVGGQVETSGHTVLMDTAQVHAGGQGSAGLWLIDPYNYTIGGAQAATISASLSGGTSVTVDTSVDVPATGSSGVNTDVGDIAVNANISKTGGVDTTLTLRAHNDIVVASNVVIGASTNRLNVLFNSDLDGSGAGAIMLNTGSSISSNGGNITLGGGAAGDGSGFARGSAAHLDGIRLTAATVDAGGGNVAMRGTGGANGDGVVLGSGSTVATSGAGTVSLTGAGGGGVVNLLDGIDIDASTVSTASGAITITGTGGSSTGTGQDGIALRASAQVVTTGGNIAMAGTAGGTGNATDNHDGVYIQGPVTVSAGGAGTVTVVGTGGSNTGGDSDGVQFDGGYTLQTASGRISINGTAGAGSAGSFGIALAAGTMQTTGGGDIDLTGTSGTLNSTGRGVSLRLGGLVRATGGGNITITGTAGGGSDVRGVRMTTGGAVSTTAGTVNILGTLTPGATGVSHGVYIDASSSVSANGAIGIEGNTLGQAGADGLRLVTGASISTSNNNPVTVTTDSYSGDGTETVSAGTGIVNIRNRTAGSLINLGGADVLSGSPLTLGLTDAELDRITAGTLVLGRTGATASGDMTISANISPARARNLTLLAGGDIVENASTGITTLANGNLVVNSDADGNGSGAIVLNSSVASNGGNITLGGGVAGDGSGFARGDNANTSGVRLTGAVDAGGGNITMHGQGFNGAFNGQYGVVLSGASLGTSGLGTINLVGVGGAASAADFNAGVQVEYNSTITGAGATTLTGTGGAASGSSNQGVHISTNSSVFGGAGLLTLNGIGGAATGGGNGGVTIDAATVTAGAGGANIIGVGGAGTGSSNGVTLQGTTGQIRSTGGSLNIVGTGSGTVSGSSNIGVELKSGTQILGAGSGTVSVTGTGGTGTGGFNQGVRVDNASISSSGSGTVAVVGTGTGSNAGQDFGVQVTGSTARIASGGGNVSVQGTGGSGAGNSQHGVNINTGGTVTAGGLGSVAVLGQGGTAPGGFNIGVNLFGSGSGITSSGGAVSVTGTGAGSGSSSSGYGVLVQSGTGISSGGTGALTVQGTGNNLATNFNRGITVTGGSISSVGGDVTLTGQGGGSGTSQNGQGVQVDSAGVVFAGGNGNLHITGVGSSATGSDNAGVSLNGTNSRISTNNGSIDITGSTLGSSQPGVALAANGVVQTGANNTVTVTTDSYAGDGSEGISAGTGTVNIRNRTAGTLINLGGADVLSGSPLTLGLSQTELARITAGTLVVGRNDATAAGAMTVSSAVAPTLATNLTLKTGSTLAVNAPITVNNTLNLSALGNVSQTVGGNITATNLLLNGPGNYALATASSNAVTALAATGAGVISYQNSSALQIGSVDGVSGISAGGPVYVGTASGDLTVAQSVVTSDTSNSAVLLNAGVGSAAGTASGGNLVFSGSPAINTGSGGRTTLMTGSVAGSTGLTAFVGAGSGRFRYNSDEVATNYTAPLGSGAYAIYREAPTVNLATGNVGITYGDVLPSFSSALTGAVNGDVVGASVVVGGAQSSSLNYTAGSHSLTPGSAAATALGYAIGSITSGTLAVAQKTLTSSFTGINRTYNGTTTAAVAVGGVSSGLVGGDVVSVQNTGANFADKNVGTGKAITVSGVSLSGADALNYAIASTASTSADIQAAAITLASSTVNKTYDGTLGAAGTATVASGTLFGGDSLSGGTFAFTDKNVGPGKTVTAAGITVNDGNGGGNYIVSYANNTNSSITPAGLTVTAPTLSKTYDGTTNASGNAIVGTLAGAAAGEQVGLPATLAYTDKNVGLGNKTTRAAGLTVVDSSGTDVTANYAVNYVDNTVSSITPAPLTVTANADARFVTLADVPGYNGAHFEGLVGGETSSVLGGSLAITRPNAATDVAAGSYAGALVPSGLSSSNYTITYAPGTYTIVPANQLLVRLANTSTVYGSTPALNVASVQYLAADGSTIMNLIGSGVGNTYSYTDGVGGSITFIPGPQGAGSSGAGKTPVGNYALADAAPAVVGSNFNGSPVFVGNLAVTQKPVTPTAAGANKTYNGTTDMPGLTLNPAGQEAGDSLVANGSGAFAFRNVGSNLPYVVRDIALAGGDAGNYYLAGGNSLTGSDGSITPAPLTLSTSDVVKTYDATTTALGHAVVTGGTLFGSDSIAGGSFAFTNKNVGIGNKTVTTTGVAVADGNGGNNYTVAYADNTTSTITPAAITVATSSVSKPFDGTTSAQGTAVVTGGSLFGTDRLFGGTFAFTDPNVGDNKTVLTSGVGIDDGNGGGNYAITYASNGSSRIVVPAVPVAGVWTQEILLPHPQTVPASPMAPASRALEGITVADIAGCVGTSQTGLDCDRRNGTHGYVVVTPVRNVSPVLAGQVLVQVVGLRSGAFEAALPLQASSTLRAQPTPATAALPNGQPLPAWLRFDPQSMVFTAQAVPANAMPLTTLVRSNNYRVEVEISEIR